MFFVGVLKVKDEKKQDPEPLVRGTDPRIHTKMSRIHNTVKQRITVRAVAKARKATL